LAQFLQNRTLAELLLSRFGFPIMQRFVAALVALGVPLLGQASSAPVGKVLTMLSDLQAQIVKEGEVAKKDYAAYAEWCEDRSRNLGFEIKTGKAEGEKLTAAIAMEESIIGSLSAKIDELIAAIAVNDRDLESAGTIRAKEAADFAAEEKELVETIDMLRRATSILERQSGVSMAQLSTAGNLAQAFETMVQASMISTGDADRLAAFAQESQKDDDEAPGAPAGAVYTSQSGNIIDTLQDLSDKAESQLAEIRKNEVANRHNYEMLKQSLTDEIAYADKELAEAKSGVSGGTEKKATGEGDLSVTSKELAEDVKAKGSLHQACMAKATAFEAETVSRSEELAALAKAKAAIEEATGAALDQVSFVQRSLLASGRDLHRYEAVRLVRDLARTHHSGALVQLASQMTAAMQSSDAFAKVKGLISDMIARLENEAGADATEKSFCDKELAETNAKKADKSAEIEKLSTRIGQMSAKSAQLKEEVAALQSELSKLARSQAEMDQLRQNEQATFAASKAELETGLTGIKAALKILTEYYAQDGKAHGAAEGAAGGIISLLEVVEADFSKNLAETISDEEAAAADNDQVSKENEVEKTTKDQDVKYKIKESKDLDKTSSELSADRSGVQAEADAVQEYLTGMEGRCIAKAETYSARKERRAAEIAGLEEALKILESETALVQQHVARKTLRGGKLEASA